jgi:2-methylcitrate dehydratase PrpD
MTRSATSRAKSGHDNISVAIAAAAEAAGASGREIIAGIVLGYEIFGCAKDLIPAPLRELCLPGVPLF